MLRSEMLPDGAPQQVRDLAGGWRRTLLLSPDGGRDESTKVIWLQATSFYVDLRCPADRPSFEGVRGATTMTAQQHAWARTQEGFAGALVLADGVFHWRRSIDLQPPGPYEDAGTLRYQDGILLERGVHQNYAEHWVPAGPASKPRWGVQVIGEDQRPAILIRVGNWFGWARGRARSTELPDSNFDPDFAFLDCEISIGRISGEQWLISDSTLPFREGASFAARFTGNVLVTAGLSYDGSPEEQRWDLVSAEGEV
jgi:hypothetical protein